MSLFNAGFHVVKFLAGAASRHHESIGRGDPLPRCTFVETEDFTPIKRIEPRIYGKTVQLHFQCTLDAGHDGPHSRAWK